MTSWLGGTLNNIIGNTASQPVTETIQRIKQSTSVDERKNDLLELRQNTSTNHTEIGAHMGMLIDLLKTDRQDPENIRLILEILTQIMTRSDTRGDQPLPPDSEEMVNLDNFIAEGKGIGVVVALFEEKASGVRYDSMEFLRLLLSQRRGAVQQQVLQQGANGIPRFMELARDERDSIRNEALLFLLDLSTQSPEIQKILAFEGLFDEIFAIAHDQGYSEGSIIVIDCLRLCRVLLSGNPSNQNHFRETSCISRLYPFLNLQQTDEWVITDDKLQIILLTLQIIDTLLMGANPSTRSNQNEFFKCKMISALLPLALGQLNSLEIRRASLVSLGRIVSGHSDNCAAFASGSLSGGGNSVLRLLDVCLNAAHLSERNAATFLFKCYLLDNEEAQISLASTLTPPPEIDTLKNNSPGTQTLQALLNWEGVDPTDPIPYASWTASAILGYVFKDNAQCKDLALKIPLEIPRSGVAMVTLLTKTMRALTLASKLHTQQALYIQVSLLRMLVQWSENSSKMVEAVLSSQTNVSLLVEIVLGEGDSHSSHSSSNQHMAVQIQGLGCILLGQWWVSSCEDPSPESQYAGSCLQNILLQRIGYEGFSNKIELLKKSAEFIRAEQGNSELWNSEFLVFYDSDAAESIKSIADRILKYLKSPKAFKLKEQPSLIPNFAMMSPKKSAPMDREDPILQTYKDMTKQLERQVEILSQQKAEVERKLAEISSSSTPNSSEVQNLKDQVRNLEIRLAEKPAEGPNQEMINLSKAYEQLEKRYKEQEVQMMQLVAQQKTASSNQAESLQLENRVVSLQQENATLQSQVKESQAAVVQLETKLKESQESVEATEKDLEDLLITLADKEVEITDLKTQLGIPTDE